MSWHLNDEKCRDEGRLWLVKADIIIFDETSPSPGAMPVSLVINCEGGASMYFLDGNVAT
jgi:hypothetical protein